MLIDIARTVVVFDLDDTLYLEADYVDSGIRYVCSQINTLCGIDCYETIQTHRLQDANLDWLSLACELTGLKPSVKESLLWMYRLHLPDIKLSENCSASLEKIKSVALAVAVLTDGRTITQKLKLVSLGLSHYPAYVSEDYGSAKPAPDRFQAIQKDFSAEKYVYVADNVQKDFLGCKPLGWLGIGMQGNDRNIYSQLTQGLPEAALPDYWVNSWEELTELLLNP
ncbi:HAD family hydrolase [Chlorobium phaeovibrioides]|uniref:HAD family hydrolase n=1 Tax=Chlorobium phaeovibrioides TaxID=1094 RepID=A0A3S0NI11_CHLPH|nr:HAD family hydrolase [Chlorobium phaeovibrioides]RTY34904.1 HAD family hydrolase [Chlorobium phaeovibrioides]